MKLGLALFFGVALLASSLTILYDYSYWCNVWWNGSLWVLMGSTIIGILLLVVAVKEMLRSDGG